MRGATAGVGTLAGVGRAVIGARFLSGESEIPPGLFGWRDSGSLRGEPCGLVLGASSIPPSKKDDEPKNHDYEEHAEETGLLRSHGRLNGGHAALHGHGLDPNRVVKCPPRLSVEPVRPFFRRWEHRPGSGSSFLAAARQPGRPPVGGCSSRRRAKSARKWP